MSLIRRPVRIEPVTLDALRKRLQTATAIHSFWGHPETLPLAEKLMGRSLAPSSFRPALQLSKDGRPMLNRRAFDECWILTPVYPAGFRPTFSGSLPPRKAENWLALRIRWLEQNDKESTEP